MVERTAPAREGRVPVLRARNRLCDQPACGSIATQKARSGDIQEGHAPAVRLACVVYCMEYHGQRARLTRRDARGQQPLVDIRA